MNERNVVRQVLGYFLVEIVVLASNTECYQYDYPDQTHEQTPTGGIMPCRSDRTTLCPPGFHCCEVTDGLSECIPTTNQRECYDVGFAHIYKGYQSKTVKGKICQRWSSKTPHKPNWKIGANDFPDNTIEEAKNYCRDPVYNGRPWCYTTDPADRWDYCDVQECNQQDCYKYGFTKQYKGFKSVTRGGSICQRWDQQSPNKHTYTKPDMFPDNSIEDAGNFCRAVGGYKPWCWKAERKGWDYCDVEICTFDFCYDDKAWKYHGFVSTTRTGRECQRWDSNKPHTNKFINMPTKFPEGSVSEAENYCRDPSWDGKPWCFTTDPNKRWEYCNVKKCKDI